MASAQNYIEKKIFKTTAVLFSKTWSPQCKAVKKMLNTCYSLTKTDYDIVEIDKRSDCSEFQDYLLKLSPPTVSNREVPFLFINGYCFGGYDRILRLHQSKHLNQEIENQLLLSADDPDAQGPPRDVVIMLSDINQPDIVVQLVDEFLYVPYGATDQDDHEDSRFQSKPPDYDDPWANIAPEQLADSIRSVNMSFMGSETLQLDMIRRSSKVVEPGSMMNQMISIDMNDFRSTTGGSSVDMSEYP